MSTHFSSAKVPLIYIGRFLDGSNRLKIGRTGDDLWRRVQSMSGQTDLKFEMLRTFPCADNKRAEDLAHDRLDDMGARRKGARKELFNVSLEKAIEVCKWAAKVCNVPPEKAWQAPLAVPLLRHRCKEWQELLSVCVRYKNKAMALGDLMALSLVEGAAASRLSQLGVECRRFDRVRPEFSVTLGVASIISNWVRVRDLQSFKNGREFATAFRCQA